MRTLFYAGLGLLVLFEVLKVYFIMPMPGSQEMNSIDAAYFLHSYRWFFRIAFFLMVLIGTLSAFRIKRKWIPVIPLVVAAFVVVVFNFKMTAESMFKQPETLVFKGQHENQLSDSTIVMAMEHNGAVKGYPIRYMVYHHQVQDEIGGKPVIATYCSVCRTGRIFEPMVLGKPETFRLVGMDHFNAMFEDKTTKSWWRQVTGEAITGPLKGELLPEVESFQVTLKKLFEQYPHALVMQPDQEFIAEYDTLGRFEYGKSKNKLTGTDSLSWNRKSWVVGVDLGTQSKAYDWNELVEHRTINDIIGDTPVVIVLADDEQSFAAFQRPSDTVNFIFRKDTLISGAMSYDFFGRALAGSLLPLKRVKAYQEFWHSWKTFHPGTKRYEK